MGIFEQGDTNLFLSTKNNQIIFEQDKTLVIGRTIEAEFPNYEKVIPTDAASVSVVDREELLKAAKICAIFARESTNIITLSLLKDKIVVSAKSPSLGENTVDVEARLTGEENQIAFNARYLLEALSNITENEINFSMTGPLNPGVFRIQDNNRFLHLIMPIRT
jgi:DNA polymerase-3 subunit beta